MFGMAVYTNTQFSYMIYFKTVGKNVIYSVTANNYSDTSVKN